MYPNNSSFIFIRHSSRKCGHFNDNYKITIVILLAYGGRERLATVARLFLAPWSPTNRFKSNYAVLWLRNSRIRKFVGKLVFNCKQNYYIHVFMSFRFVQKNMLFKAKCVRTNGLREIIHLYFFANMKFSGC